MKTLEKIAVGVFKDKKVLLVMTSSQEKKFYTLGGKVEEGESDMDCINREVMEEISSRVDESSVKYLTEVTGPAHGKDDTLVHIKFYAASLLDEPKPSSEIVEIKYFDSSISEDQETETGKMIMTYLKENGLVN